MFHKCLMNMATFKAVVQEHHKKSDGSYNVKIRITHKRKTKYLATNIFVFKEDLTRGFKIKNAKINDSLETIVKQYYSFVSELGIIADMLDVEEIINRIKQKTEAIHKPKDILFFNYANGMIDKMNKDGRQSTANNYRYMLNSLNRFAGDKILFSDINVSFLNKYESFLKENGTGARGLSLYMGLIRAVFNEAIRELNDYETDTIIIKGSPFTRYKIKKEPPTEKRALPVDKICAIANFSESELKRVNFSRDMFMLSFYLIGMNSADLYYCSGYVNGRITYNRRKTASRREDKAEFSALVPKEACYLIEKYKDPTGKRVFRFYLDYANEKTFNHAINGGLKVIAKEINEPRLVYYSARHSWATIARNDLRIDKYTVHEALNHVDEKMKITDIYTQKDWSHIDDANRYMLNYFILMLLLTILSNLLSKYNKGVNRRP